MPSKNLGNFTITDIKYLKNKVQLIFEKDKLDISKETFTDFTLFKGKTLNEKDYQKIVKREKEQLYLNYAINLLSKKAYSVKEIQNRLTKKGASEESIAFVINYLKKYQLLDDNLLLQERLDYGNYMHYGRGRIIDDLYISGVPSSLINNLSFPFDKELEKALFFIPKLDKQYSKYSYKMKKNHAFQSLVRLGFDNDVINQALENLKHDNEQTELVKAKKEYQLVYNKYKNKYKNYELKEKITNYLLNKGYSYNIINKINGGK